MQTESVAIIELSDEIYAHDGQRIPYHRIYAACRSQKIPSHRLGKTIAVLRSDIPVIARTLRPKGSTGASDAA